MRPIILYTTASIDGFVARRDGSIDWVPATSTESEADTDFALSSDPIVMGRRTYDAARAMADGAPPFPGRRCIVFSRRRAGTKDRRVEFVGDDPAMFLRELREEPVRPVRGGRRPVIWLVGGGEIVRECLEGGVVDEIVLTIAPLLLGDGVPLFLPRGGTTRLRLHETKSFPNGAVQLRYGTHVRPFALRPPVQREEVHELAEAT